MYNSRVYCKNMYSNQINTYYTIKNEYVIKNQKKTVIFLKNRIPYLTLYPSTPKMFLTEKNNINIIIKFNSCFVQNLKLSD